ncbi:hypothetical protein FRC09_017193 [Ceratobasidium sp. 395]|nr:hypothetical protein FRC09_017193 [Ceratobasidium sp. 395]
MSEKSLKATYKTTKWEETGVTSAEDAPIKVVRVRTEREFKGGMALPSTLYATTQKVDASLAPTRVNQRPRSLVGIYSTVEFCLGAVAHVSLGACYFKGSIGGSEEGEVVFWTTKGSFGSVLEAEWTIDEKTALGGLKGLKGHGGYRHEIKEGCFPETEIWLNYHS